MSRFKARLQFLWGFFSLEFILLSLSFPSGTSGKEPACQCRRHKRCVQPLGRNVPAIPWREGMAIHSSILAWRSPGPEEPGRLQSMGLQRVGHDWGDLERMHSLLSFSTSCCSVVRSCPTLQPHGLKHTRLPCPSPSPRVCSNSTQRLECLPGPFLLSGLWNSPGQNTGVGSLSFLQGIFPTQELNWGLLHKRWILYQPSYQGSPSKWKVPNASLPHWVSFLCKILAFQILTVSITFWCLQINVCLILSRFYHALWK